MKKMICILSCLTLCGLAGCGLAAADAQTDPAVQMQENTAPRETEAEEAEYLVWNPAKDEYYDSRFMTWNAEKGDYDYLTPDPSEWRRVSDEDSFAEISFEGTVPDSLKKAFDDYSNAMNRYYQERTENEPGFDTQSYLPFEDDKGSYRTMCSICAGEWDALYQIAASDGEYRNLAQAAVNGILLHGGQSQTKAGFYCCQMQEKYKEASEAVRSLGESITAADCTELEAKYGYLIAPALQEAGRLDLLPINPESPCTDTEMLAEFARCFAAV